MNFDKNSFRHIQILSWDLLVDNNASELPVKVTPIANLHRLTQSIDYSKTRWENGLKISKLILNVFGLNYNAEAAQVLAIRILCPLCILKDCGITTSTEISLLCEVPIEIATKRLKRLEEMKAKNIFYTSNLEKRVRENFNKFITNYLDKNQ